MNKKQFFAIREKNKKRILELVPNCSNASGIYIMTRRENGFKFAYIGQAEHLLQRLADHLSGYQHIDLSIKKHGLWSNSKPYGWEIQTFLFPINELDEKEQYYIKKYANAGYQLRNKTSGSQSKGKADIADEPRKGYQQGLKNGYEKARKEIAHLFKLHLNFDVKKQGNKVQEKAKQKFNDFLNLED